MRNKLIIGNWKMNLTVSDSVKLAKDIVTSVRDVKKTQVAIAPTYLATAAVAEVLKGSPIKLAVQDIDPHENGAYTGKISVAMVRDLGVSYIIIGHSEQRQYYGETDPSVNSKLKAILAVGLGPIICIGETLTQRKNGEIDSVLTKQIRGAYEGIPRSKVTETVIAYEPIWAIGTGVTATDDEAWETIRLVRSRLASLYDHETANSVTIQYGGSMKPENATGLLGKPDIDGGLIGGASLKAPSFVDIVKVAEELDK